MLNLNIEMKFKFYYLIKNVTSRRNCTFDSPSCRTLDRQSSWIGAFFCLNEFNKSEIILMMKFNIN